MQSSHCEYYCIYLVLPFFDYCSSFWDSYRNGSKSHLDKLNRRAACIILGPPIRAEELKSTLGWTSLQAHRDYLKCVLVFKCLHGMAPLYLHSEFRYAHQVHGYNTSSHDLPRPPGENCYVPKRRSVNLRLSSNAILDNNTCTLFMLP